MLRDSALSPSKDPEASCLYAVRRLEECGDVCVACLGGARVRCESELSDAAGDCSVGYFAGKVFVAGAPGFGGGCGKDVLFLC